MGRINRIPFPQLPLPDWELDFDSGIHVEYEGALAHGHPDVVGGFASHGTTHYRAAKTYEIQGPKDWLFLADLGFDAKWSTWFPRMRYWDGNWYCATKPAGYWNTRLLRWTGSTWASIHTIMYGLPFLVEVDSRLFYMVTVNTWREKHLKVFEVTGPTTVTLRNNLPLADLSLFWGPNDWGGTVHNRYGYLYPSGGGLAYAKVATNRPIDCFNVAWDGVLWQGGGGSGIKYKISAGSSWITVPVPGYYVGGCASLGGGELYTTGYRIADSQQVVMCYDGSQWSESFELPETAGGAKQYSRALYAAGGTYYLTTTNGKIYRKRV